MAVYDKGISDILLITHELNSENLLIYTNLPFSNHIEYSDGALYGANPGEAYDSGFMKLSADAYELAISSPDQNYLQLFMFDPFNIMISDDIFEYSGLPINAIEFSRGGGISGQKILYGATDYQIYQFITNSTELLQVNLIGETDHIIKNLQLGVDGKIYVGKENDEFIGVIYNPETQGVDCFYDDHAISKPAEADPAFNGVLPNIPANYFKDAPNMYWFDNTNSNDTLFANNNAWFYVINNFIDYVNWDFGDGNNQTGSTCISHTYNLPGVYDLQADVYYINHPSFESQKLSKKVVVNPQPWMSIIDYDTMFLCQTGNSQILEANYNPNNFLVWESQDGSFYQEGVNSITIDTAGIYYLKCFDRPGGKLVHKDTAIVITLTPEITFTPNGEIYPNDEITFNAEILQVPPTSYDITNIDYDWFMGDGGSTIPNNPIINYSYQYPGNYTVYLSINYETCNNETTKNIEIIGDVITPSIVEICPAETITLTSVYPDGEYINEWHDEDFEFLSQGQTLDVDIPGKYILVVSSIAKGIITIDTSTVYSISPTIETTSVSSSVYDNIFISTKYNQTPSDYIIDPIFLNFNWNFGDGNSASGINIPDTLHNYQFAANYTLDLTVQTANCDYPTSLNLQIFDEPAPFSPDSGIICDGTTPIEFNLNQLYDGLNCNIYRNDILIATSEIISSYFITQNGEYKFEFLNANNDIIAYDTVRVFEYSTEYLAIGDDAMPSTTFDIGENIYISANITELPYNFIGDYENISYQWIFDGITIISGTGFDFDFIDTVFYSGGIHNIKLQTTYNSCTKFFEQDITIVGQNEINIILPQDTIICDNTQPVTLSIGDEYNDYFIEWTKIDGYLLLAGFQELECEIYEPGEIVVRIFTNEFATDTIISDTARIFWFAPDFSYSGSLIANEPVEFYSYLNSIPDFYNNFEPLYYTWEMGDQTTYEGYSLETLNHSFTQAGNYEVKLTLSTSNCEFIFSNNLLISGGAINVQISPEQPVLCDPQLGDEIELSVMPNNSLYFIWYHEFLNYNTQTISTEIIAEDTNNITVNRPGKYIIEAYHGADVYYDTVLIDYKNCNIYDATLSVNGTSGLSEICASSTTVDFEISLSDQSAFCPPDFNLFSYVWDFGDGLTESITGSQYTTHTYDGVGEFLVSLYIFDNKNCEKVIRKKVKIFTDADTAIIYQVTDNVQGDIEIDFNNIPEIYSNYYNKNIFVSNINSRIIPFNSQSFNLDVTGSTLEAIQSASDVMLYLKIAQIGDIKVTLKPPLQGTEIEVVNTSAQPNNYIFGKPAIKNNNWLLSKTNSYILTVDNELPIQSSNGIYYNEYFSVDSIYTKSNFYYFKSGIYKSDALYNTQDEFVNGTWQLLIQNQGVNNGLIESWGLIFNNEYFYTQIKPDSMVCTDQFGFEYNVVNDKIMLNNSGVSEYTLACNLKYPNSSCEIIKTILVKMPDNSQIPEYFSPNGDGINDYWEPVSPDANAHIIIVDKNGNIVADYYSNEDFLGWDGTFRGNPLPSDSYWFIITLANDNVLKGIVTIVR
ncbi:MAG: PKD domain-containing protein [Bacteroidales bacterium]|nr:PKD domain-containing protein [Bacteroidales bacterium]